MLYGGGLELNLKYLTDLLVMGGEAGNRGCGEVYGNTLYFVQLFCKPKTALRNTVSDKKKFQLWMLAKAGRHKHAPLLTAPGSPENTLSRLNPKGEGLASEIY